MGWKSADMKTPHEYGVYLWWPGDGQAAFHPDDRKLATKLIPSRRVFLREDYQDGYTVLVYGSHRLRIRPSLFLPVEAEGLDIGDQVQVLSRCGQNRPFIGYVVHRLWHIRAKRIEYLVRREDRTVRRLYLAEDLEAIEWFEGQSEETQSELVL
jgi:hypothetical protein